MNLLGSTVKLWRLDQARMPISLGRADIVTDPAMNVRTIAKHRFLDKHQIKLEQPSRQYAFYSGVCLLWKDARPAVQEGQPAELPTCESPPTNDMTEWPQMEDLGVPRIEETARSKPARRDHRKQNAKVQWLRQYFTLLPDRLPGDLNCALARQALDRYLVVSEARRRVKEVLDGKYPAGPLTWFGRHGFLLTSLQMLHRAWRENASPISICMFRSGSGEAHGLTWTSAGTRRTES